MRASKLWVLLCIMFISEGASAAFSKAELAMLPYYCNPKYSDTTGWSSGLGGIYHYCNGLDHLNKYSMAVTKEKRRNHYRNALADFNYFLIQNKRYLSRNPLAGDIYYSRGKLYALAHKTGDALQDWYKAIAVKPRLRRAYLDLARYLEKHGQKDEALKVISKGLRYLPKSKSLQKRYRKLGGKLPYPEPIKSKRKK